MSIAYPMIKISVTAVVALGEHRVSVGSVWVTGNLLFRARACGADIQPKMRGWAHALDDNGRAYLLYAADHPKAGCLVSQPLDSCYCFEIFPFKP
ncbi:MAG: hypothetical protein JRL30_01635 [Deltaproteobacteria bacterium]|nr:hypothetical protein [Deltaproteobacteria bacterium]